MPLEVDYFVIFVTCAVGNDLQSRTWGSAVPGHCP